MNNQNRIVYQLISCCKHGQKLAKLLKYSNNISYRPFENKKKNFHISNVAIAHCTLFKAPYLKAYFLRYISKNLGYDKNNLGQMFCLLLYSQSQNTA